jgi:AmiR/NasT family two-component response regulator
MARVLVCGEDQLTTLRIGRELAARNVAYDQQKSLVKQEDLTKYELVIVHSSWKMPNLSGFIENLVLQHEMPVIYLSSQIGIGALRAIMEDPYFAFIDDQRIDAELGIAMHLLTKTATALRETRSKAKKAVERADLRRQMDECKKKLIASGMTEDEAHAVIIKTAMDRQVTKYDACAMLLRQNKSETD